MRAWPARRARHARHRASAAGATAVPFRLVALTDARTGAAHLLTDEAMAAGRRAGGRYAAECGAEVLPASLTAPEHRSCPDCAALTRPARSHGTAAPRHRR